MKQLRGVRELILNLEIFDIMNHLLRLRVITVIERQESQKKDAKGEVSWRNLPLLNSAVNPSPILVNPGNEEEEKFLNSNNIG